MKIKRLLLAILVSLSLSYNSFASTDIFTIKTFYTHAITSGSNQDMGTNILKGTL